MSNLDRNPQDSSVGKLKKIKLISDYYDYYDAFFDYTSTSINVPQDVNIYRRIAGNSAETAGPDRKTQFTIMKYKLGEKVIPHGTVKDMMRRYSEKGLVVYTCDWMHAGRGKFFYSANALHNTDLSLLSSLFITTDHHGSVSYKYVKIGLDAFWLKISAPCDWRTNVVASEVEVLNHYRAESNIDYYPVYAIDYVKDMNTGEMFAIDLNHAPGLRNLGIKDYLTAKDAVESIKKWYEEYGSQRNIYGD